MQKKRMTQREKTERARIKKKLQKDGLLPPDKPKLNRKKFVEEAQIEWNERDKECLIWDLYLMSAISYMLGHRGKGMRLSPEAIGVAKALKIALRLREFEQELKEEGASEYKLIDQYEYIKDILEA